MFRIAKLRTLFGLDNKDMNNLIKQIKRNKIKINSIFVTELKIIVMNGNQKLLQAILDIVDNYPNGISVNNLVTNMQRQFPDSELTKEDILYLLGCLTEILSIMNETIRKKNKPFEPLPPNKNPNFPN